MISMKELNPRGYTLTAEQIINLRELHTRINKIREAYAKPMLVTSGVRDIEHHRKIYIEKAKASGVTNFRVPMGSKHLFGQAVDISDPNCELQKWIMDNVKLLEEVGLWCEDFSATKNWVHFQTVPPKSGKRFFLP